tara:strand:+ start:1270 stop:1734 length:465 start_codon:yes stop_codon:yes gene_type:complete
MKKKTALLYIFNFFFFLLSNYSYAEKIIISSEQLEVFRDTGLSIFKGNVYASDEILKIWTDHLEVKYNQVNEEITQIEAKGNVKIIRLDLQAKGDYSIYHTKREELFISGEVVVTEGSNVIECDELTVDLINSKSIMKSSKSKRIKAQIFKQDE